MTLVMSDLLMLPEALRAVQVCAGLEGWVATVTEKAAPLPSRVPKTKPPLALKGKLSPPLICNTRPLPRSPVRVPPTVYVVPPAMGHPHSAHPSATIITTRVFIIALRKILQLLYDSHPTNSCLAPAQIRVKNCVVAESASRLRPVNGFIVSFAARFRWRRSRWRGSWPSHSSQL